MGIEERLNGNGRKPFTVNLKADIMADFKKYCDDNGYLPARRLEILMLKDIDMPATTPEQKNSLVQDTEGLKA